MHWTRYKRGGAAVGSKVSMHSVPSDCADAMDMYRAEQQVGTRG
jgi:hypothetical protein